MESFVTPLKCKSTKKQSPRRFIIDNLLNYSQSLSVVSLPFGKKMIVVNN